jgi:hypothetical protein
MPKKDKPILKTYKANHEHREKKTDTANQNHRRPKRKPKTLKPISETRQNQPETMPTKKTPLNEKVEDLKTCLLKNIKPKTLF